MWNYQKFFPWTWFGSHFRKLFISLVLYNICVLNILFKKVKHVLITILKNSLPLTTKLKKTLEKIHLEVDNIPITAWKVSKYEVFSGPYFPAFELNTERYEVSVPIQSKCEKIQTRKNSVFEHFSRSPYELYLLKNTKVLWGFSLPDAMTYWKTWLVTKQHGKPIEFFH